MTSYNDIDIKSIKWIARNGNEYTICTTKQVVTEKSITIPVYSHRPASDTVKRVDGESKIRSSVAAKVIEEVIQVTADFAQKVYELLTQSGTELTPSIIDDNYWSLSVA